MAAPIPYSLPMIDRDSLSRLAHATGMTDVEFDERSLVEAQLASDAQQVRRWKEEEACRDEWCEGAGIPPDPFTEAFDELAKARHAAMVAQAEADRAFWNEQEQVDDDAPEDQVEDLGHHDQYDH